MVHRRIWNKLPVGHQPKQNKSGCQPTDKSHPMATGGASEEAEAALRESPGAQRPKRPSVRVPAHLVEAMATRHVKMNAEGEAQTRRNRLSFVSQLDSVVSDERASPGSATYFITETSESPQSLAPLPFSPRRGGYTPRRRNSGVLLEPLTPHDSLKLGALTTRGGEPESILDSGSASPGGLRRWNAVRDRFKTNSTSNAGAVRTIRAFAHEHAMDTETR